MGEQVSEATRLCDLVQERANYVFGKRSMRLLEFFSTGRLPSKSGGAAYRRLYRRLLRPIFSNVVMNNVTTTTTSASERYVRRAPVWLFIMFSEYMFSCYLFLFILLFRASPADEDTTHRVLMFSIPGSCQGRSPLEGYMKPARPNTLTWSRREKLFVNPNWLHI
jgi:hypothetical protein